MSFDVGVHRWVFITYCTAAVPQLSSFNEERWGTRMPKEAALSKCLKDQGFGWKHSSWSERTDRFSLWFHLFKSVTDMTAGSESSLYSLLISSSCCVGAFSSSLRSSRKVSPGRAANPDRPVPNSPARDVAWMSSAHEGLAPSPPETQRKRRRLFWCF